MRLILLTIVVLLDLCGGAGAQTGRAVSGPRVFEAANCSTIPRPVFRKSVCWQTRDQSLRYYANGAWVTTSRSGDIRGRTSSDAGALNVKSSVLNVKTFGAQCTCANNGFGPDDSTAFQNTINAAKAVGGRVYVPATNGKVCFLAHPVLSKGVEIFGDGPQLSLLKGLLLQYPDSYEADLNSIEPSGAIKGPSLVTGSANSLNFPGGNNFNIILSDNFGAGSVPNPLNGATALTIEGWLNIDSSFLGQTEIIFQSGGADSADPNATLNSASLSVFGNSSPRQFSFTVNINGTSNLMQANASVSDSTSHYYAAVLDPNGGSPQMCLFVDGNRVGSVHTVTGGTTITQRLDEVMQLGGNDNGVSIQWPVGGAAGNFWKGQLLPIRISKSAKFRCSSSTITVPTAPLSGGGAVIAMNGNKWGTPVQPTAPIMVTENGGSVLIRNGTVRQGAPAIIHDLGTNILTLLAPQSRLWNIAATGASWMGVGLTENSYSSRIYDLQCLDNYICLGTVSASDADIYSLNDTGSMYTLVGRTGDHLYGHGSGVAPNALAGLDLGCGTATCTYTIVDFTADTETGTNSVPIKINGPAGTFTFISGQVDAAQSTGPIWINPWSAKSTMNITFINTNFVGLPLPGALVHFIGTNSNPFTWINPVVNGHLWSTNTVPITDEPLNLATVIGDQGPSSATLGLARVFTKANLPACNAIAAHRIACVSDATGCTASTAYTGGSNGTCLLGCDGKNWREMAIPCLLNVGLVHLRVGCARRLFGGTLA